MILYSFLSKYLGFHYMMHSPVLILIYVEMTCAKEIQGSIPSSVKSRVVLVRQHRIQIRAPCCTILQCAASLCLGDTIFSPKTERDSGSSDHTWAIPQRVLFMRNCQTPLKSLSPLKNLPGACRSWKRHVLLYLLETAQLFQTDSFL